jgi:hypothetical protein
VTARHQALAAAAGRLRRAVERGSFEQARISLTEYGARVEEAVRGHAADGVGSAELAREAGELLAWARHMALVSRAAAATRFKTLPRPVRAYRSAPLRPRHTFELQA